MKKLVSILTIVALCATLVVGCSKKEPATDTAATTAPVENTATTAPAENTPAEAAVTEHAEYTVYNSTGVTVTELYLYDAGSSDKGENLAGAGMEPDASIVITRDATKDAADAAVYVLEFVAEGMGAQSFNTLHFEVAPISLLSVDAASGATAVSFSVPKKHAEYTVTNSTGVTVTELYLYDAGSSDKGENLAGAGMAAGDVVTITRDETKEVADAAVYVLEFVAEGMGTQSFDTLHFEVAPIYLLSVDAASGATAISFREPKQHAEYTVYNTTGVTVTELYLYDAGSSDKGENLAGAGMAAGDVITITRDETKEVADAAVYVLEFVAEGMEAQSFNTLHFEVAPISLLSVDAASGATAISFKKPE